MSVQRNVRIDFLETDGGQFDEWGNRSEVTYDPNEATGARRHSRQGQERSEVAKQHDGVVAAAGNSM